MFKGDDLIFFQIFFGKCNLALIIIIHAVTYCWSEVNCFLKYKTIILFTFCIAQKKGMVVYQLYPMNINVMIRDEVTMSSEVMTMIAVLISKPGQRDNLKSALKNLILPTRSEPCCLDYVLFQLPESPDTFYIRESWRGQEGLNLHYSFPHFKEFINKMDDLLMEPLKLIHLNPIEP